MTILEINNETKEGRMLIAALAVITTSPKVTLRGKRINGQKITPMQVLQELDKLQKEIYKGTSEVIERKTFAQLLDKYFGKPSTKKRIAYEKEVAKEIKKH